MNYRRNFDGYYDPTAGEAIERIVRDERRKRRQERISEQAAQTEQPVPQKHRRQRYVNAPKHRRC